MAFLSDSKLKELATQEKPPISGLDLTGNLDSIRSPIQPCSVDLRIHEIFLPLTDKNADIKSVRRTEQHELAVGESVKVTTREVFDLGNEYGALLLAPARLTRRGIIVPDQGHIDPGFRGKLRLTLINMGRNAYKLKSGDSVATILLFRLDKPCAAGLSERKDGEQPYEKGLEDLRHLSPDFLNIQSRVETIASKVARSTLGESGWRRAFFSWCLPIILGILTALVTYFVAVESRLTAIEAKADSIKEAGRLEKRIDKLEEEIEQFRPSK